LTKEQYLAQRKALMDAAQALISEGKADEANAKMQEMEALDAQYDAACLAQANLNALKDKRTVTNLAASSVTLPTGAEVVDRMDATASEAQRQAEARGTALKLNNSVTVAAGTVLLPSQTATDIRPTFNKVSSLIDRVASKTLMGGESYKQPYLEGYGEGDYTDEGDDYNTAEPTFAYAAINKSKVTAYAEDTEELQKLPAANYDAEVIKGITVASRKKVTREILVGTGATNRLAGIFSTAAAAIDADTDMELTAIDENTLSDIMFGFGGDEDVEDAAVLILNKVDLKSFAQLRTSDGQKIHDVKGNGNVGTIDGVPYIINSACKAVTASATTTGQYCMAYGPLSNYQLVIFSGMDIQRSTDYKFKQGMIAHRGSVFLGGNVVSKNGFLRIKKA